MKRWRYLTVLFAVIVGLGFGLLWHWLARQGDTTLPGSYYTQQAGSGHIPKLDHVVIIVEENHGESTIIGNKNAPYINTLAHKYAVATNYYATAHPSLPNYLEMTSGTNGGITNDCNPPGGSCLANVKNITDEIELSGRTWKEYAEDMSAPCTTHNVGNYATKHNPFVYYSNILNDPKRCATHVVPFTELSSDLHHASLPNYAFITPNLCNDMHNCSVKTGDDWLRQQVPAILQSRAFSSQDSLLIITWDEGEDSGPNHVPAIFAGPAVKRAYTSKTYYSHYSLLRTIEASWSLHTLTHNDATAPIIHDVFRT